MKTHHPEVKRRLVLVSPDVVVYEATICQINTRFYHIISQVSSIWILVDIEFSSKPLMELFPKPSTSHFFCEILASACHIRSWYIRKECLLLEYILPTESQKGLSGCIQIEIYFFYLLSSSSDWVSPEFLD